MSWAVGAIDGLHLISFKDAPDFVLVHGDESRQRYGEVVSQAQIALPRGGFCAAHEDFEQELVAFFTVFAHERFDVFDSWGFDRQEAVFFVDFADDFHHAQSLFHLLR